MVAFAVCYAILRLGKVESILHGQKEAKQTLKMHPGLSNGIYPRGGKQKDVGPASIMDGQYLPSLLPQC